MNKAVSNNALRVTDSHETPIGLTGLFKENFRPKDKPCTT